jgi:multidrug efflux pump subunit AcrB
MQRNVAMGKDLHQAILDGAQEIAVPAFVSTICICIVFVPMFFLAGVARYLFVPLAEAVVFALLASYFFSRTIIPTLVMFLLPKEVEQHHHAIAERPVFTSVLNTLLKRFAIDTPVCLLDAWSREGSSCPAFSSSVCRACY